MPRATVFPFLVSLAGCHRFAADTGEATLLILGELPGTVSELRGLYGILAGSNMGVSDSPRKDGAAVLLGRFKGRSSDKEFGAVLLVIDFFGLPRFLLSGIESVLLSTVDTRS